MSTVSAKLQIRYDKYDELVTRKTNNENLSETCCQFSDVDQILTRYPQPFPTELGITEAVSFHMRQTCVLLSIWDVC